MTQQPTNALDDRQAETESGTAVFGLGTLAAIKLFEDAIELALFYARPGVPDFQTDQSIARTGREQHPAPLCVADRIGQQIANHSLQQQCVAINRNAAASYSQRKSLGR